MEPLSTVIIPCFNLGAYVAEAVDSVLDQQGPGVETILIDDGSTDSSTRSVLDGLARRSGLRFIRTKNRGVAAARNLGIEKSRGRFVCFLDADDRLYPGALPAMHKLLNKQRDAALVYPNGELFGLRSGPFWRPGFNRLRLLTACTLPVPCLIRKSKIGSLRFRTAKEGFEYEDWDFFIQLTRNGRAIGIPRTLYGYRERAGSRVDQGQNHHDDVVQRMRRFNPEDYSPHALMRHKRRWAPAVSLIPGTKNLRGLWRDAVAKNPSLDLWVELPEFATADCRGKYILSCKKDSSIDAHKLRVAISGLENGVKPSLPKGWHLALNSAFQRATDPLAHLALEWASTKDPQRWANLDEQLWRLTNPAWTLERLPEDIDELAGAPSRIAALQRKLTSLGAKSYSLFGAGKHPKYLLGKGWLSPLPQVIYDDAPSSDQLCGIPVLKPPKGKNIARPLVVCSDAFEKTLYRRAMEIADGSYPVLRIYS